MLVCFDIDPDIYLYNICSIEAQLMILTFLAYVCMLVHAFVHCLQPNRISAASLKNRISAASLKWVTLGHTEILNEYGTRFT